MRRTVSENLKPPEKEVECSWVNQTWRQVESVGIEYSVRAAGFGDCHEWMMWRHDVYGKKYFGLTMKHRS